MASLLGVPSLAHVPPLSDEDAALLAALSHGGAALTGVAAPLLGSEAGVRMDRFVYRRWVLEALMTLLEAPAGFNALSAALAVRGESLATKTKALQAAGFVRRRETRGPPLRVTYTLTPLGARVARAAFVLTHAKAEMVRRAVLPGTDRLPASATATAAADVAVARERYDRLAQDFQTSRSAPPHQRAAAFATARRFSALCVRRWQGAALSELVASGPLRFTELRARLGAGNDSLASTLRHAHALHAVDKLADGRYAIADVGVVGLMLGVPVIVAALP